MVSEKVRKVTTELSDEIFREMLESKDHHQFRAVPHPTADDCQPVWRVRFQLAHDASQWIGLDINGEVMLGRAANQANEIALFEDLAEQLGMSRHHVMLRPTPHKLYIIDLDSTNGSWLNGRSIGVQTPYNLSNGDMLRLGQMEVIVEIVKRPVGHTAALQHKADFADILPRIATSITSQLKLDDVFKQAMDMAMSYTEAGEVTAWLVNEQTGELFFEAGQGIDENQVLRLPITNTLAGKVVESGEPLIANRNDGEQIKVKTGYFVEAVIYVPLKLGGVTFGVLSAAHRDPEKIFTQRDKRLMMAIADFTAVAVQNARQHTAINRSLTRHAKIVTALDSALAHDGKDLLNTIIGYAGLLRSNEQLDEDSLDMTDQIVLHSNKMSVLLDKLVEVTHLVEFPTLRFATCDLVEVVHHAVADIRDAARARGTFLEFQMVGDPYLIHGDATRLYYSVLNLLDNAVKFSPDGARVWVYLAFGHREIIIRVRDNGPGIPEEDLPQLFDHYFRGKQNAAGEQGLGLGLELARTGVEAHRGNITARNAEDRGAEFIITLPSTLRVG